MGEVTHALLLTLIAGAATGAGGALILFRQKLSSNFLAAALGLSAGVMIFISLAELYPEAQAAIEASDAVRNGKTWVLLSFFTGMGIITLIDFLIPEYENPHEATGLSLDARTAATDMIHRNGRSLQSLQKLGIMSALAIAIHNFPEGMATFIGAMNDSQTGAGITFAIAIHNIPEGIAVAIPIYYPAFPLILAAIAGIMIYISLDELLPTAEKYGKHHVAIAGVVSGMAIMGISLLII